MVDVANKIRADFDRLAELEDDSWEHNQHYHKFLLKQLPKHISNGLEIGCGTGTFARLLAQRAERVVGVDLSPRMIESAKQRSPEYNNIEYKVADIMQMDLPNNHFDCIASIATLHHLSMENVISKLTAALCTNGTLLILDLYEPETRLDLFWDRLAVPVHIGLSLLKNGGLSQSPEVQAAWEEHGKTDSYLTLSQVHQLCASHLPNAKVRRHLLWRYSLIWRKTSHKPK